ncbi:chromosome partitioning protein ParB [Caldimicrobium thiodismutans]|jgi:ParB family chromosome partitioning protein|uniref:Chromosome partitioning protein ParB n=1 Tax=Caldimicrobium thiodismutans TaxID=1653476 RepID=A0A0U4N3L1_9BACT|nr:ParB/RepB/Spo0J family partition protein [Caldimicrobium thiodismutans]BAU23878.1 chromosome partitioning protein ParB [Caldimicrobium thiodismutans]
MALKIKKKVLGKGLSELIPELSSKQGFAELPVDAVTYFSYQPRITFKEDESFQDLLKSIQEKGILQPIVVRKITEGLYECVAGERRLRAAKKLGLNTIPVIIKELSDEEALLISVMENLQRKDLNPMEIALAYKNLMDKFGYTQEEVAEKVGKDRATVANFLRLLKLPKEIQDDLLEERLTVGHAKALLSLPSEELQLLARRLVLEKGLSVRETEKLVEKLKTGQTRVRPKEIDPDLLALSEELSQLLGSKVEITLKKKKPCFILHFDSLESAEAFLEKLRKTLS